MWSVMWSVLKLLQRRHEQQITGILVGYSLSSEFHTSKTRYGPYGNVQATLNGSFINVFVWTTCEKYDKILTLKYNFKLVCIDPSTFFNPRWQITDARFAVTKLTAFILFLTTVTRFLTTVMRFVITVTRFVNTVTRFLTTVKRGLNRI